MSALQHLGFPAPLLGLKSLRLPVLLDEGDLIALAKPAEVLVHKDSWYPRLPVLVEAIRYQAGLGKPEFRRQNIGPEGLWPVCDLDPEFFGPVVFARRRETAEELRNQFGSGQFDLTYRFIASTTSAEDPRVCELPLARHDHWPRMLVSHATGKKARTAFTVDRLVGAYALCTARIHFPRRHQLLLHAYESGLPVLGDVIYAKSPAPLLSNLKRSYRPRRDREERPLFEGPAAYLETISHGSAFRVTSPEPPRWKALLNQLEKQTGR
ncbi:MAG: pseudouridine synthase [Oceanipulchritudo sp.]